MQFGDGNAILKFDNCSFELVQVGGASAFILGRLVNSNNVIEVDFNNCSFKFNHAAQHLEPCGSKTTLSNCRIDATGVMPDTVFKATYLTGIRADMRVAGCDLSHAMALYDASSVKAHASRILLANCLVPAALGDGVHPGPGYLEYELHGCGTDTDDHAYQYNYQGGAGIISYNTGVYQTSGGATFSDTDGTDDPQSLMMVSSAYAGQHYPLYSPWFNVLISTTGSKTLSVNVAHEFGVALKDNECWIEAEYMGDAANPLTSAAISAPVVSGTDALDILAAGSNLTDTAEAWTGLTTEITHTLSKSVTVNQQGFARVRVVLSKPSATIYVDPQVTVA